MNGYWTLRRLLGYARNDTEAGYIMGRDDTQVVPYGGGPIYGIRLGIMGRT